MTLEELEEFLLRQRTADDRPCWHVSDIAWAILYLEALQGGARVDIDPEWRLGRRRDLWLYIEHEIYPRNLYRQKVYTRDPSYTLYGWKTTADLMQERIEGMVDVDEGRTPDFPNAFRWVQIGNLPFLGEAPGVTEELRRIGPNPPEHL